MSTLVPMRLAPGEDLREALQQALRANHVEAGFVVADIGSLSAASIRRACAECPDRLQGSLEILTLAGSLSPAGCHLQSASPTPTVGCTAALWRRVESFARPPSCWSPCFRSGASTVATTRRPATRN